LKHKDEYARTDVAEKLAGAIRKIPLSRQINIMEVCGTHTQAIARLGIRSMLPGSVRLLSGPGCPVCVTGNDFIDHAIALSALPGVIITTFGDLFRVPGSYYSLQLAKGKGADVRIVYSSTNSLEIARQNPDKKVIFLGVGFETTAPTIAATIIRAHSERINNFFVLSGFKTIPNALKYLAELPDLKLDGLIAPGHLSTVTGIRLYEEIADKYGISSVITGFEALDILEGIRLLCGMIGEGKAGVINEYSRVVKVEGNKKAQALTGQVFEPEDSNWRGIGVIQNSGLKIREEYSALDARKAFKVNLPPVKEKAGCICGKVLTGVSTPFECPNFGKVCTPIDPIGACMVSSEGTCAAYYKYLRIKTDREVKWKE